MVMELPRPAPGPSRRIVSAVDFSWLVHRSFHAVRISHFRDGVPVPTGHMAGVVQAVSTLARRSDLVLLAVDSPCPGRREVWSGYKAARRTRRPSGDPLLDYNPFADLPDILGALSHHPNVRILSGDGLEADDIMAALIGRTRTSASDWHLYFSDHDILQTWGRYSWHDSVTAGPVDVRERVMSRYGYDLDFLPLFHKVIRGDRSDGIPPSIPGFPSRLLASLAGAVPHERDLGAIVSAVVSACSGTGWESRVSPLLDTSSELYRGLARNHALVLPRPPSTLSPVRPVPPPCGVVPLLASYGIGPEVLL